jgi:hypothetical protein
VRRSEGSRAEAEAGERRPHDTGRPQHQRVTGTPPIMLARLRGDTAAHTLSCVALGREPRRELRRRDRRWSTGVQPPPVRGARACWSHTTRAPR